MPKSSHIQTNFSAGAVSPKIYGRVDVSKYENGAEQIKNWIVTPQGGVQRTPGTSFVGEVRNPNQLSKLIPFEFSTSQAYMIELNDGKMRFYRSKGRIMESSVAVTAISKASPGVVSAASHGYSDGDFVILSVPTGMTEVNGIEYKVANKTDHTFELNNKKDEDIDTSGFTTFAADDTVLLVHADSDFSDSGPTGHSPTAVSTARITTAIKKFGDGSGQFDSDDSYVTYPNSANFNFGTGNFSIDAQIRFKSTDEAGTICSLWTETGNQRSWTLDYLSAGKLRFRVSIDGTLANTDTYEWDWEPVIDTFYHVEMVRSGNTLIAFVDGVSLGSISMDTLTVRDSTGTLNIGAQYAGDVDFNGYIDELRILKGSAAHTANFEPPSASYTSPGTVAKIYEIAQPYDAGDLKDLQFVQTADIMYLVHEDYSPRKLSRTGHAAWTLATVTFTDGPYLPANTTATTLACSSTVIGTGRTLTASVAIFSAANHTPTTNIIGQFFALESGYVLVTAYVSTTVLTVSVISTLDSTNAVTTWSEGAWSPEHGNPRSAQFYEQRLVFAGSTDNPQTTWLSVSESFENMTAGTDADDALIYTIATEEVNAIRWMKAGKKLALGTSGGIFSISSGDDDVALTPTNVQVSFETGFGVSKVVPKKIGSFTYYVQRDTKTLRELSFSFEIDSFKSTNISILSDHITKVGISEMGYQQSPYNILWCLLEDGKMATMTREIDQEVAAWSGQQASGTDDKYENIGVIPASDLTEGDEVWFIVKRVINGITTRFVEYLMPFDHGDNIEDAHFVQSGLKYTGAAATTFSGLDHLEGESVLIFGKENNLLTGTVSNGQVTVSEAQTQAIIGLGYESRVKTLRVNSGSAIGTSQGMFKRINKVILRVINTTGLINIGDTNTQNPVGSATRIDGDVEAQHDGGWDTEGQIEFYIDNPLPAHITAVIKQLETSDR